MCTTRRTIVLSFILFSISVQSRAGFEALGVQEKIDEVIRPLIDQKKLVGATVGVIHLGESGVIAYGTVSLDAERAPDGDTVYEIGSITKTFTAILLAKMSEEGTVKLEYPAQMYLP